MDPWWSGWTRGVVDGGWARGKVDVTCNVDLWWMDLWCSGWTRGVVDGPVV